MPKLGFFFEQTTPRVIPATCRAEASWRRGEAGIQSTGNGKCGSSGVWIPAFAGMTRGGHGPHLPKRVLPVFLTLLLLSAFPARAEPQLAKVERASLDDRKAVIATVESVHDVQARARINGTISIVNVKEGDQVKAGDKIALVGDAKLGFQNQGLAARFQSAQAGLNKAKLDFARVDELRKSGFATQARWDEARTNLYVAEHNLDAAQAEQKMVLQQTSEGAVLAPSTGRILRVPVTAGSVVMAGEVIATLSQENYILRLELPERHARFLKAGDPVLIAPRGLQDLKTEKLETGTVRLVYPEIKEGRVIADVVADGQDDYFVGERTRVFISTGRRDALLLPQAALFERAGVTYVRLASGQEIPVQTGAPEGDKIEILAGVNEGDEVMLP